uniref:acetyltransferase n=1 Tax=Thaumasiovibrio occultus TaxID=1891184 RepID=UPI000B361083|nr:acetyltransferase [Thaumasiovibrio occultus]
MHYDVFNGDADGIASLLQLRLAQPKNGKLITGVKRDIKLLRQVSVQDNVESVTVLDISMEKNIEPLMTLLAREVPVFYCDHHRAGEVPASGRLTALIDLAPEVCTSLLINDYLQGQFAKWAVVGAFGDNLFTQARQLATRLSLSEEDTEFLLELGTLINYNGYGTSLNDLHIEPAELYRKLLAYPCPLMLREDSASPYYELKSGYAADYHYIADLAPLDETEVSCVYELPNEAWARRISGVFGNELANMTPNKAHAVLTLNDSGDDYTVSVRAPLENRFGADEICSAFPTGGGRKAAAGINQLPVTEKAKFIQALTSYYA